MAALCVRNSADMRATPLSRVPMRSSFSIFERRATSLPMLSACSRTKLSSLTSTAATRSTAETSPADGSGIVAKPTRKSSERSLMRPSTRSCMQLCVLAIDDSTDFANSSILLSNRSEDTCNCWTVHGVAISPICRLESTCSCNSIRRCSNPPIDVFTSALNCEQWAGASVLSTVSRNLAKSRCASASALSTRSWRSSNERRKSRKSSLHLLCGLSAWGTSIVVSKVVDISHAATRRSKAAWMSLNFASSLLTAATAAAVALPSASPTMPAAVVAAETTSQRSSSQRPLCRSSNSVRKASMDDVHSSRARACASEAICRASVLLTAISARKAEVSALRCSRSSKSCILKASNCSLMPRLAEQSNSLALPMAMIRCSICVNRLESSSTAAVPAASGAGGGSG
mmetsp:Transcript_114931/g.330028  ORF Transcript_114931/g.330028 Transcript_114931/m.330028 type:complete len:401 (+) Transcript_114931:677-1879(+)